MQHFVVQWESRISMFLGRRGCLSQVLRPKTNEESRSAWSRESWVQAGCTSGPRFLQLSPVCSPQPIWRTGLPLKDVLWHLWRRWDNWPHITFPWRTSESDWELNGYEVCTPKSFHTHQNATPWMSQRHTSGFLTQPGWLRGVGNQGKSQPSAQKQLSPLFLAFQALIISCVSFCC